MINLGPAFYEVVSSLREHPKWPAFLEVVEAAAVAKLQDSLNAPTETLVQANFYARAWNDLHVALVAATKEINPRQVPKLGATLKAPANV